MSLEELDLFGGCTMELQGFNSAHSSLVWDLVRFGINPLHVVQPEPDIDDWHLILEGVTPRVAGERPENRKSVYVKVMRHQHLFEVRTLA
jgi:hypothetical protein